MEFSSSEDDRKKPDQFSNVRLYTTVMLATRMYFASLDHYIIEELRPSGYCRYMDDFVLWASPILN